MLLLSLLLILFNFFFISLEKLYHNYKSKNHDLLFIVPPSLFFLSLGFTLKSIPNKTSCKMFEFSWKYSNGISLCCSFAFVNFYFHIGGLLSCHFFSSLALPNSEHVIRTICFRWLHFDALHAHTRTHTDSSFETNTFDVTCNLKTNSLDRFTLFHYDYH